MKHSPMFEVCLGLRPVWSLETDFGVSLFPAPVGLVHFYAPPFRPSQIWIRRSAYEDQVLIAAAVQLYIG